MEAVRRIGMLTPSSNTVVEPATMRLAAPLADQLTVHFSRVPVTVVSDDQRSHRQFEVEPLLAAARLLTDARVDTIVWNGTSGSWEGLERDRELVRLIGAELGVPATTATLALLDAFGLLNVRRYGLVVPYIAPITARITATLDAQGYSCTGVTSEGLTDNLEFAAIPPATIAARVRRVAAGADAVAIHCTNLRGAEVAASLASELGAPVLDSVVVAFWGALRCLGLAADLPGFGGRLGLNPGGPE